MEDRPIVFERAGRAVRPCFRCDAAGQG